MWWQTLLGVAVGVLLRYLGVVGLLWVYPINGVTDLV